MDKIFELNTVNNVKDSVGTSKVKATSPIVEVFSALSQGNRPTVDGKVVDKAVAYIKELAGRATVSYTHLTKTFDVDYIL